VGRETLDFLEADMKPNPLLEVYFDFDNTITGFDVLDDIILRFSSTTAGSLPRLRGSRGDRVPRMPRAAVHGCQNLGGGPGRLHRGRPHRPAFAQIVELLAGVGIRP